MILLSLRLHVPRQSTPFRTNFERTGKGMSADKTKIITSLSQVTPCESTCSNLHYDTDLINESQQHRNVLVDGEILFGEAFGDQVKGRSPKKLKSLSSFSHLRSVFLDRVFHF